MARTRKPFAVLVSASSNSSSEEDTSSSGDEHEAEQHATTKPPILSPPPSPEGQEGDSCEGDDEEYVDDTNDESVGSSNVTAKRAPSSPPHLRGLQKPHIWPEENVPSPKLTNSSPSKRMATAAELAEPSPSKKKAPADVPSKSPLPEKPAAAGEHHHTKSPHMAMPAKVAELPEKAVGAKKAAESPEKAVAAKKVAKPPPLKKAAASAARKKVAKQPSPSKAAAAAAAAMAKQTARKDVASSVEKHLQEKTEAYWYLAQVVNALEREHNAPGMFTTAFLNIADGEAAVLNAKIKKQRMAQAELFIKRCDLNQEVIRIISNLISDLTGMKEAAKVM